MPDGRAPAAAAEHLERRLDHLRDARTLERDINAEPARHRPDRPDGVAGRGVDGLEAHGCRLGQPVAAPNDDDPSRTPDPRRVTAEEADRAGAGDGHGVARGDVAAVGDVQGDGRRIDQRPVLEREALRQREDRLDALHDVGGVGALDAVAVLAVQPLAPVVLAQVVAPFHALATHAAGVVAGARHAVADLPAEALGPGAQGRDLARPLVPRDERERGRPEARVVAPDEVGVGAADGHRADPREDLVGSGFGDRDLLDLEHRRLEDDEGLHRGGQGGHRGGLLQGGAGLPTRKGEPAERVSAVARPWRGTWSWWAR